MHRMQRTMVMSMLIAILLALANIPTLALAQQPRGDYYGPHMMWDGWYGMFLGPLIMIVFIVIVVLVVTLVIRWLGGSVHDTGRRSLYERDAIDILKERFARGEIDKEEYEERRRVLEKR